MSATNDADAVGWIKLPDHHHKVLRWTVHSGSSVQAGETIGFATMIQATDGTSSAVASTISSGHKRPHKRARHTPGGVLTAAPERDSDPHAAETLASKPTPAMAPSNVVPILAPVEGILHITDTMSTESDEAAEDLVIARVQPCLHPTVIDNLCAVCGKIMDPGRSASPLATVAQSNSSPNDSLDNNDNNPMTRMTVAGLTVSISQQESRRMAEQDALRLRKTRKLSLVLDLDHTLVHATNDPRAAEHLHRDDVRSILLPLTEEPSPPPLRNGNSLQQQLIQHFLKFRPHLKAFFERLMTMYEIGVYTAGTREYAEQVCMVIARLLVGATRDQVHLLDMRHRIAVMEYELNKSQRQDESVNEPVDTIGLIGRDETGAKAEPDAAKEVNDEPLKKMRKVTFGEPPAEVRSDHSSQQRLEELRAELAEAERLERLAQEMRQTVFGSRIVSRSDVGDLGRDVKCLKRIFPCGGAMAVVVDDREDVWARAQGVIFADRPGEPPDNLLLVRPYHWDTFSGFADVNNAAGVDLSNLGDNQARHRSELDLQLLWTCNTLVRLHDEFYCDQADGKAEAAVPQILAAMRRQVLSHAHIVLSGLVPLHHQQRSAESNQPRPAVIRYVESLGATYETSLTSLTTHVVASKDGTDKILNARKVPGCFIVKPSWLMECVWSLTRRSETAHLLGPPPRNLREQETRKPPLGDSTRSNASSSSDDDDDDADDLADELEREMTNGE